MTVPHGLLPTTTVRALLTGPVAPLGPKGLPSAIAKNPRRHPVAVTVDGLAGDAQADRRVHGGPDKALHHYPADHAAAWHTELPGPARPLLDRPGAFGENISTLGLTEEDVCIGDVFRVGTATLQVSQGRQPCWKLNLRFAVPDMAARVQTTGRTGWYYRVLEEGLVAAGDALTHIDRPRPDWTLARIQGLLYRRRGGADDLAALAAVPELAQSWKDLARRRLERGRVEDWRKRLRGPADQTA